MNPDPETGEYFWTEEEQTWVANNQAYWNSLHDDDDYVRPDGTRDYESIYRVIRNRVRRERLWKFVPHIGSRYYVTTFRIPGVDHDLAELRVYREFDKETKTYKVSRMEYRKKAGRVFKPIGGAERVEFRRDRLDARLYVPGLRIYHTGARNIGEWKDAEYLSGDNLHVV
jgi:hypothetical protein